MTTPCSGLSGEFGLIRHYFADCTERSERTVLGIGDDCALLAPKPGQLLAVTADTLVAGVHFFPDVAPRDIGYKSLAVSLSDLAAMGAAPAWVTLCLTLPAPDEAWLSDFMAGFTELARSQEVELVGGDTTRGPLSITVQALGHVDEDKGLRRSGAAVGELVCVTGQLGSAGLGLKILRGDWRSSDKEPVRRLLRPEPRVAMGRCLAGRASACIDVSDGLAADLGHILQRSGVGATLEWERLPLSAPVQDYVGRTGDWALPLVAGDDYELCFTVPEGVQAALERDLVELGCACTVIGRVDRDEGLHLIRGQQCETFECRGYDHFEGGEGRV